MTAYQHAAYVRTLVAELPPLTTEQRARLAALLRPSPGRAGREHEGGAAVESA